MITGICNQWFWIWSCKSFSCFARPLAPTNSVPFLDHPQYFVFIITDFVVQFSSAIYNRRRINVIAEKARTREQRMMDVGLSPYSPRIIMTAVGYREDGEAWKKCLQTLDVQLMMPQAIM